VKSSSINCQGKCPKDLMNSISGVKELTSILNKINHGFLLSRRVEAIQTAMPYEHKMVERDIIVSPMDTQPEVIPQINLCINFKGRLLFNS